MTPRAASAKKRRTRAPDATRDQLLWAAFDEIYRRGFRAASVDAILSKTGLTKGALYHHFPNKSALGYAVVDEVVRGLMLRHWLGGLDDPNVDPLMALQRVLRNRGADPTGNEAKFGCPLNNLAQEMAPVDDQFRRRVNATFDAWRDGFARALERGQAVGSVKRDVDTGATAAFLVASIEGAIGLTKTTKNRDVMRSHLEILADYLETLRTRR
jgi:TetR/AcrR family transcriptional regulator, transcriptional repressor for nem operon